VSVCADTLYRTGAERSAKADHGPAAQKGDFSHRHHLGASRPVSVCADTLYRTGAERSAQADHGPVAQ